MTLVRNAFALLGEAIVAWMGWVWVTTTLERSREIRRPY